MSFLYFFNFEAQKEQFETDDGIIKKPLEDLDLENESLSVSGLKKRIENLLRIKDSVQKELLSLEKRRSKLQKQVRALENEIQSVKTDATKYKIEFEKMKIHLKQAKASLIEYSEQNTPELRPPLRLLPTPEDNYIGHMKDDPSKCTFGSCFDLSR